ncbi:MAG: helix-turn-helix transcriptional regulator [Polyangiaceae bacterium]|nr:helix-turn-helix transcriptional regulator [Polyangiaceae bacterium]MCB9609942.1 helix-turn-helix transcriptional regulator [Polyangiaceae bacterium]
MADRGEKTGRKRVRRTPEEAKALILNAALALFADHGPDAVGLKEVAAQAGVSHGLITHYFGTYEALVEAAFQEHVNRAQAVTLGRVDELIQGGPEAWVALAAEHLNDPTYGRLVAWALMSGRLGADDFITHRAQGLRRLIDAIDGRFRGVDRSSLEFAVILVMSASLGYSLARKALWGSLGSASSGARGASPRDSEAARDAWFREKLSKVVLGLLKPR